MIELTKNDIEALEIGAAILGTGGGGNPYYGKLHAIAEMEKGSKVNLIRLSELDDDALVISVGNIGAPAVSMEKICEGNEIVRAIRAIEEDMGKKVDAIIPVEIGGANGLRPIAIAAITGLPLVDGDGMGRAFPEMQMTTFSIYGHCSVPAAMSDAHGNTVIFKNLIDEFWLERLARACVVQMGGGAGMVEAPMKGRFVKKYAVPGTVTQATNLGLAVMRSHAEKTNPIEEICAHENGKVLFEGKIVDLERNMVAGFTRGKVKIEGSGEFSQSQASIDIQNENLILKINDEVACSVPDLIIILDIETGHAITTEILRYGQKVAVLAIPCHPLLRSEKALEIIGPAAFGYPEIQYVPFS
ncbi:DUF917 domain-containing protein [Vibrio spartinae]|uniref:Hydantoinase n=1 Tax=Vibrio spartinae TaxID=1918945 RepID=A0A1N6M7D0_9VIBR|nr:DUF917 domain-containing protein [Vibrio spartinae]QMV14057.1 hypothetical protein Vspart_01305 [Vibrio spartinae]SIO95324.1 hypothetical protein VSP9026_03066 [Vibrio spartinae]